MLDSPALRSEQKEREKAMSKKMRERDGVHRPNRSGDADAAKEKPQKSYEKDDIVNRSDKFRCLIDGGYDQLDRVVASIKALRWLANEMCKYAARFDLATSKIDFIETRTIEIKEKDAQGKNVVGPDGEPVTRRKRVKFNAMWVTIDRVASKAAATKWFAEVLGLPPLSEGVGKASLYEFRPFCEANFKKWNEQGGLELAGHVFDWLRAKVDSTRRKVMPDHGKVARHKMEVMGEVGSPRFNGIGVEARATTVSFHRDGPSGNRTARRYIEMRLGSAGTEPVRLIVLGDLTVPIVDEKGKAKTDETTGEPLTRTYKARLERSQMRQFDRFVDNRIKTGAVELNFKKVGKRTKFTVRVSYQKKRQQSKDLHDDRTLEVAFQHKRGHDIPRKKKDTGKDHDKRFVIHLYYEPKDGERRRVHRIAVDDVFDQMLGIAARSERVNRFRSLRAMMPEKYKKDFCARSEALRIKRSNAENTHNHRFVLDIVHTAKRWLCRNIVVYGLPSGQKGLVLDGGVPWGWADFMKKLKDSAEEFYLNLIQVEDEDIATVFLEEQNRKDVEQVAREDKEDEENGVDGTVDGDTNVETAAC